MVSVKNEGEFDLGKKMPYPFNLDQMKEDHAYR